jgi:hypothetical protein
MPPGDEFLGRVGTGEDNPLPRRDLHPAGPDVIVSRARRIIPITIASFASCADLRVAASSAAWGWLLLLTLAIPKAFGLEAATRTTKFSTVIGICCPAGRARRLVLDAFIASEANSSMANRATGRPCHRGARRLTEGTPNGPSCHPCGGRGPADVRNANVLTYRARSLHPRCLDSCLRRNDRVVPSGRTRQEWQDGPRVARATAAPGV